MALSAPQSVFGIHSVTAYNPDTGIPYGTAKVVGSFSLNLSAELIELTGGSSAFPFAIETGTIATEGTIMLKEIPDWLYNVFLGNAATTNAAESAGAVTALTNVFGTTCMSATIGVASVGLKSGSSANVKAGMYVVKAASATTVDVYAMTDVDFARGSDLTYQTDLLKITGTALTISTGTAVEIPNTGLELTGGSGTIGMTIGHTAIFDSRPINTSSTVATVGSSSQSFVDVGLFCTAQKKGNDEIFMLDIMRAKAIGYPFSLNEKAFMESEVNLRAFKDSARDGLFRTIRIDAA